VGGWRSIKVFFPLSARTRAHLKRCIMHNHGGKARPEAEARPKRDAGRRRSGKRRRRVADGMRRGDAESARPKGRRDDGSDGSERRRGRKRGGGSGDGWRQMRTPARTAAHPARTRSTQHQHAHSQAPSHGPGTHTGHAAADTQGRRSTPHRQKAARTQKTIAAPARTPSQHQGASSRTPARQNGLGRMRTQGTHTAQEHVTQHRHVAGTHTATPAGAGRMQGGTRTQRNGQMGRGQWQPKRTHTNARTDRHTRTGQTHTAAHTRTMERTHTHGRTRTTKRSHTERNGTGRMERQNGTETERNHTERNGTEHAGPRPQAQGGSKQTPR